MRSVLSPLIFLHLALVDAVAQLRPHYDYILIDCPPRLSLVSFAALCASDGVMIPMEAADWGAQGITQVSAAIDYVQERFNGRVRLLGYLVSRYKRAGVPADVSQAIASAFRSTRL